MPGTPPQDASWRASAKPGRPWWRSWRIAAIIGGTGILVVAGLVIGREIVFSNYYVTAHDGIVSVMRGVPGSILGLPMQRTYRHGCLTERNDLNLIAPGQEPSDCQLFRVTDLQQAERAQVEAGLPTGSEDDAIVQIRKLAQGSVLPVCLPPTAPTSSVPTAPGTPTITALPPPPPAPGMNCRELR
jgi:protein phosphatase